MQTTGLRLIGDKIAEPYQHRVSRAVQQAIVSGRSGAVLAPTGSGKSLLVTAGVEDAIGAGKPVLVLQPDVSLLRQNFALFMQSGTIRQSRIAAFIAQNETLPADFARNSFLADVIVATNMSLVNKADDPEFQQGLRTFGQRGGVVLIDEGQTAAAEELSGILRIIAEAGGSGVVYTATPFRTDGRDILEPFGAAIEHDLLDIAGYDEVMATGRTVPTRFCMATGEFEAHIGAEAVNLIESAFLSLLGQNKSIDQASRLAFSRYFRPDASEADRAIAELVTRAVCEIWRTRAHQHTLAMIHCDSVGFARELAATIAATPLPDGHPRAGQPAAVAFVVASEIIMWRDGEAFDRLQDRRATRDAVLEAARAGAFDVLVNVNALGVGTDVPQTDLNILACQERSVGPVKQISGRGERAHPDSGKSHQLLVDIGNSIYRIFNDIDAMRRDDPERSRRQIRGLAAPVRAQFEAWFDTDPELRNSIDTRTREIRTRQGASGETHQVAETLDATSECGLDHDLPVAHHFAHGIFATGNRRYNSETRAYSSRTAIFVDLVTTGIYPETVAADAPRWLAVTHDSKLDIRQAFVAPDLDTARKFAAFVGIRYDDTFENTPPTGRQLSYAADLQARHARLQGLISRYAKPTAMTQVATIIELLKDNGALLGRMLTAAATRFIQRAAGARHVHPQLRSIILHNPNQLTASQRDMLSAYCRLRSHIPMLDHTQFDRSDRFSITTYDPATLPEVRDVVSGTRFRLFVVDTPDLEQQLKQRLLAGLMDARIIAMGPDTTSDAWIRKKAGMPGLTSRKADAVSRERETAFESVLYAMTGGPLARRTGVLNITLTRPECVDIARAAADDELTAPIGNLVKHLLALLAAQPLFAEDEERPQMEAILRTITTKTPSTIVSFKVSHLAAKFGGLPPAAQKQLVKIATRAAELDHRRQAYGAKAAAGGRQLQKSGAA